MPHTAPRTSLHHDFSAYVECEQEELDVRRDVFVQAMSLLVTASPKERTTIIGWLSETLFVPSSYPHETRSWIASLQDRVQMLEAQAEMLKERIGDPGETTTDGDCTVLANCL